MPKTSKMKLMDGRGRRKCPSMSEEEDLEESYEGSELEYSESSSGHHTSNDIEDCFACSSSLDLEASSTMSDAPYTDHTPTNCNTRINGESTIAEALQLYIRFLRGQIISCDLQIPDILNITFGNDLTHRVKILHSLAVRFSALPQRKDLYGLAQRIDLDTLNYDNFQALLKGLFEKGGVTYERVIVLFFFCSDLSIRVLKEQLIFSYFKKIFDWTLWYFKDHLCIWVELHGGWSAILPAGFDNDSMMRLTQLTILGVCCIGIIAICVYIRNKSGK